MTQGFAAATLQPIDLYNDFLSKRQFNKQDETDLGLELLSPEQTWALLGHTRELSIKVPYFDVNGKPTQFNRVRLLQPRTKMKYSQARASGSHIYFPPKTNWRKVMQDVDVPIILTEGEFKAWSITKTLLAQNLPYACVGLAGVTSWTDKSGLPLHRDLMQIKWSSRSLGSLSGKSRPVYIIFDYDGAKLDGEPNEQVALAESKLAVVLKGLQADVHLCRVGRFAPTAGQKYAIDDHLLNPSATLTEILTTTSDILTGTDSLEVKLHDIKTKYAFYNGEVIRLTDGYVFSLYKALVETGDMMYMPPSPGNNAQGLPIRPKPIKLLNAYVDWPKKLKIKGIGMYPEYQGIQITPEGKYNTLVDWAHEPLNGDPALYLEEIDNFFRDEPLMIDYWHDFVANIIQRPWIRNNTCPQFLSPIQGIGKSAIPEFIAEMMGNKYGQPATVIGPGELFESKNQELEGKLFVVVNEPNSDQNTHQAKFKDLITSPRLMIDRKYGAKFSIDNYINYVLTTNKPFVVQMDDGSRREAIYRPTSLTPEEMAPRIKRLMEWGRTQNGFGIVLNWYTQRDLSKFDPKAPAPMTDHKRAAVELSRTPLMAFAADLSRWVVEKLSGRAAFAPVHLIELCKLWGYGDKTQVSYIRRAMSNFGEVDGQKLIKVAGKPVKRTLFLTSKEANGGNLKNATTLSYADLAVQTDEYVTAEINGEAVEKF